MERFIWRKISIQVLFATHYFHSLYVYLQTSVVQLTAAKWRSYWHCLSIFVRTFGVPPPSMSFDYRHMCRLNTLISKHLKNTVYFLIFATILQKSAVDGSWMGRGTKSLAEFIYGSDSLINSAFVYRDIPMFVSEHINCFSHKILDQNSPKSLCRCCNTVVLGVGDMFLACSSGAVIIN